MKNTRIAINHKTLPPASIKSLMEEKASVIAKNIIKV
jgi:hypothetical protein